MGRSATATVIASILSTTLAFAATPISQSGAGPAQSRELSPQENELTSAFEAADQAARKGPAEVRLGVQAVLHLPAGYVFVPALEGARFLRAMGDTPGQSLNGLVMPTEDKENWFITIDFHNSGYIRDDDARNWDVAELLSQLKASTAVGDKDRLVRGFPAFEVAGWAEEPQYDATAHRLAWSALVRDRDDPADSEMTVNHTTYALGREGYYALDLIAGQSKSATEKQHAHRIVAALAFNEGKRYTDFVEGEDRVADYGIAALSTGAAPKKLGLLALIGAFFAKSATILVAAAGLAYGFKRFLTGRRVWPEEGADGDHISR